MRIELGIPGTVLSPCRSTALVPILFAGLLLSACQKSDGSDAVEDGSHADVTQAADHAGQYDEATGDWDSLNNPDLPDPDAPFYDAWADQTNPNDETSPPDLPLDMVTHPWEDWIPEDYQAPAGAVELTLSQMGGFDDFSSAGAALGYAVDAQTGWLLLVALRFQLPTAYEQYDLNQSPVETAAGYLVPLAVERLAQDGQQYPLLKKVWTDTAGLRNMAAPATVLLVREDSQAESGIRIYVASHGILALNRLDGPKDIVTGLGVGFQEVTSLGPGAQLAQGDNTVELTPFYIEWSTQP